MYRDPSMMLPCVFACVLVWTWMQYSRKYHDPSMMLLCVFACVLVWTWMQYSRKYHDPSMMLPCVFACMLVWIRMQYSRNVPWSIPDVAVCIWMRVNLHFNAHCWQPWNFEFECTLLTILKFWIWMHIVDDFEILNFNARCWRFWKWWYAHWIFASVHFVLCLYENYKSLISTHTYAYIPIHTYTHTYAYIHIPFTTWVRFGLLLYGNYTILIHTHTHTHTNKHVNTHTHTHTHTYIYITQIE